jgi:hypothetical protein
MWINAVKQTPVASINQGDDHRLAKSKSQRGKSQKAKQKKNYTIM